MTEVDSADAARPTRFRIGAGLVVAAYIACALSTMNLEFHSHGDIQTRTSLMVSAKHFGEEGFIAHRFTPLFPTKQPDWTQANDAYYTHFPPLPYYVGGALWAANVHRFDLFRIWDVLVCAAFLATFYLFLERTVGAGTAFCSLLVLICSRVLYTQAQVTPVILGDVLRMAGLLALIAYLNQDRRNHGYLALSWLAYFLCSQATFEYIVSFGAMTFALSLAYWGKRAWFPVLVLATAPFAAQVVHFLTNVWVFGGVQQAIHDLTHAYEGRTVGNESYSARSLENIGGLPAFPEWLARRLGEMFHIHLHALAIAAAGLLVLAALDKHLRRSVLHYLALLGLFVLADLTFYALFPQLTVVHIGAVVGRNWLTSFALLHGGLIYFLLLSGWRLKGPRRIAAGVVGLAACMPTLISVKDSAVESVQFLAGARQSPWAHEFAALKEASTFTASPQVLLTTDPRIAQCAFYHQPRESFGLPGFPVRVVYSRGEIGTAFAAAPDGTSTLFLTPVRGPDPETHVWGLNELRANHAYLQRVAYLGNPRSAHEWFPAGTAASAGDREGNAIGDVVGTYSAAIESVEVPGDRGDQSRYALRITPKGANRSGIQLSENHPIRLVRGVPYLVTWRAYGEAPIPDLRFGFHGAAGLEWALDYETKSFRQSVAAGEWTTMAAVYTPTISTETANLFVLRNGESDAIWYLDDVRIGELGGYELARVHRMPEPAANAVRLGLPADHPAGGSATESSSLAPLGATYGAGLRVVDVGAELDTVAVGRRALQVTPNGEARSGFQQDGNQFVLEPGAYQYAAYVYTPTVAREILLGIQTEDGGILAVRDTVRRKDTLSVPAGEWTEISGLIDVPATISGGAQLWIVGWDPLAEPWYIDGIELTRVGP